MDMKKVLKKIFPTHYLINKYIEDEYRYFETDKYDKDYMDFLWDSKLNLHIRYFINILALLIFTLIILK
jgi:hypothetical protein